jgi:hypothetical protein
MLGVFGIADTATRIDLEALGGECGGNVILCGKWVAACNVDLGASCSQDLGKVCGLCLEMYRKSHLEPFEWKSCLEFLFKRVEKRHMMSYPVDFQSAVLPELRISDFACHFVLNFTGAKIVNFEKILVFSYG